MKKKLSAREALLAMAQVFTDYPERHCKGKLARDEAGAAVDVTSPSPYSFCAMGFLRRLLVEGLINEAELARARKHLNNVALFRTAGGFVRVNDQQGREAIVNLACGAAARLA
jgi:hypothetical protein